VLGLVFVRGRHKKKSPQALHQCFAWGLGGGPEGALAKRANGGEGKRSRGETPRRGHKGRLPVWRIAMEPTSILPASRPLVEENHLPSPKLIIIFSELESRGRLNKNSHSTKNRPQGDFLGSLYSWFT